MSSNAAAATQNEIFDPAGPAAVKRIERAGDHAQRDQGELGRRGQRKLLLHRALSGAGIGAGVGAAGGALTGSTLGGAALGGAAGAATGALTNQNQINLGKPWWK